MEPNEPLTVQHVVSAIWAAAIGLVAPWVILGPLFWWLDRRRDRRFAREQDARQHAWAREQEARQQAWARERQEAARLSQLRDQLWVESLPAASRERILEERRQEREREELARAMLAAER
jgi:DNA segregation ATPase FtsK/SpoIIIE-like protein